ncbi:MAG: MATE family efflux transporter [Oscillospiraceae bacterium]|jgi:putative MATE family efflux protein
MHPATAEQAQYNKMTQTPIPKLIVTLAVPTVISMMTTAIYNMADTAFVSQLGTSAAGAVGIVFSLMAIIQAIGFMLGMGAGSLISRLLGQQKNKEANRTGSTAFFTALAFGLLLSVFGLLFLNPLMGALGATPTILPYARDYAQYILFGAPVMCASFVLNNLLRSQGKAFLSMFGIATGGILNIGLDPLFIFVFGLGIGGAAIATLLSQCVSFCILLSFFLRGKSVVRLSIRQVSRQWQTYWLIVKTGLPSFCRQGLASIATVALNVSAAAYGDPAVAAMSIVGRIFMLVLSAMLGFGQGYQPVVGFNYGAKKYGRVRHAFRFSLTVGLVLLTVLGAVGFLFAPQIMALFRRDDAEVIAIGALACRAQCVALIFQPLIVICNMTFQVLGRSWQATFISCCRQGIFFLPLILILPACFGLTGVQFTQPAADLLTFACCFPLLRGYFRDLKQLEQAASAEEVPAGSLVSSGA